MRPRNFYARGAPKISGKFTFFRGNWAQNLRDPDAGPSLDAFFFGSECNANTTNSQRRCEVYAQLTLAECMQFFVRGSCRISGKFSNFSRDFCSRFASSRRWTRDLSCIRTHTDSDKSCNDILRFAQPRWPSARNFCARGAPKNFSDFAILGAAFKWAVKINKTYQSFFSQ